MKTEFKDYFSGHASDYAAARPGYPPELATYLAGAAPGRALALDCGCGSGQLSVLLAEHFDAVVATDASAQQIAHAKPHPRVRYTVAPAEASGLPDASADLVVAAQAAHWFDMAAFNAEARRVLRPGGVVALVAYGLLHVDADVDGVVHPFYAGPLAPHWPPDRRHVDEAYRNLPFPFAEGAAPAFEIRLDWSLPGMLGYLRTWSAVKRLAQAGGSALYRAFEDDLAQAWGPGERVRTVRFPLALRIGTV